MISHEEEAKISKGMLTLNVIWAAMLIALSVYLFIGLYLKDTLRITMDETVLDMVRIALFAVALITLFATKVIRRLILSGTGKSSPMPASPSSYERYQSLALAKYTTALVVSLALTESIGIFGLVLFLMGRREVDLYLFMFVSAAAMLFYRPKRDELVSLIQELDKQASGSLQRGSE
jgi:hypothetical protein